MHWGARASALGFTFVVACSLVNAPDDPQPVASTANPPRECEGGLTFCSLCVELSSDPDHCGACGHACHADEVCSSGECLTSCPSGESECDGSCADLESDPDNCGACDDKCTAPANAVATCDGGECTAPCASGFDDCDGDDANGCERDVTSDVNNCGICELTCAAGDNALAECSTGQCLLGSCVAGFGNCDANVDNGCETVLAYSNDHCTQCGMACSSPAQCWQNSCTTDIDFSGSFTMGQVALAQTCSDWNFYRQKLLLPADFASVTLRGSLDASGVSCAQAAEATQICQALAAGNPVTVNCEGTDWTIGVAGLDPDGNDAIEINAGTTTTGACTTSPAFAARPCVNSADWGGISSDTCGAPSQTIVVVCQTQ